MHLKEKFYWSILVGIFKRNNFYLKMIFSRTIHWERTDEKWKNKLLQVPQKMTLHSEFRGLLRIWTVKNAKRAHRVSSIRFLATLNNHFGFDQYYFRSNRKKKKFIYVSKVRKNSLESYLELFLTVYLSHLVFSLLTSPFCSFYLISLSKAEAFLSVTGSLNCSNETQQTQALHYIWPWPIFQLPS